jgi:UDP-N-acetyl-D-glucosamine dehydrogenase
MVNRTVRVSSITTAEAVKLTENIFRAVNIGLVNELKVIFETMGVDIWEVIEAAASKPFGFMPFYPGPGLGGHCIPIDPFYLTWKAREFGLPTRFIEVAGEVNAMMPSYVVAKLAESLDTLSRRCLSGSSILVLGVAYKKNIDDIRESPAFTIMDLLRRRGANLAYHDPYVPVIDANGAREPPASMQSVELAPDRLAAFDAAVIITDHAAVDYRMVVEHCPLVVDTRNATRGLERLGTVIRA